MYVIIKAINYKENFFMIGIARANTNIALIKYWGKKDTALFIPMNSSLSLTLDAFYTDTKVEFDKNLTTDSFYLNGVKQQDTAKITNFLNLFRENMDTFYYAKVESYNFVPTAAGLASSASAFCALAMACNIASGLNYDLQTLSTFARRGSGSATRSVYGGFVEWQKGTTNTDSYAKFIDDASWDIGMIILVLNAKEKKISSRIGMNHTVETSPFYEAWLTSTQQDLEAIKQAIQAKDFQTLGKITEHNGMKMHATTLSANPPFSYFEPESLLAQEKIRTLRDNGYDVYITMDAGPNVKILCRNSQMLQIKNELLQTFKAEQIILSNVGQGVRVLSSIDFEQSIKTFKG